LLVARGLASELQVAGSLRWQREHSRDGKIPLGKVLVDRGVLTQAQIDEVLGTHLEKPKLGESLIKSGVLSSEQLSHALSVRERTDERLGQILVKLKYVSDEQLRQALARQCDVSFIDLDGMSINRSLSRLINHSYAKRHGVLPVAALGDMLTVCF